MEKECVDKTSAVIHYEAEYKSHYKCIETLHKISVVETEEKCTADRSGPEGDNFSESGEDNAPEEHFLGKRSDYHESYKSERQRNAVEGFVILNNVLITEHFPRDQRKKEIKNDR